MRSFILFAFIVLLFVSSSYAAKRMQEIVGGSLATQGQFPFMVSLDICGSSCGGFLISAYHVGTAAHCFDNATLASCITAQAGTIDISSQANGQIRNASSFHVNPNFDNVTLHYDAAIITLASPFTIDNVNTRIASLATNASQIPANGSTVYVAGWGATSTGGPGSSFELFVDLPYINLQQCNNTYFDLISGVQICAGGVVGKDSCQGDSGGPLFTTSNINDTIDAVIIGIVSYGGNSCAVNDPGVYSDVSGFANAYFQSVIATSGSVSGLAPSLNASSVAPSSIAGSSVVGSSIAGSSVAGSSVAGSSQVAGSSVAGSSQVAASSVAGSSQVAGSSVAGSSQVAGSSVAGSSQVAGSSVAGSSQVAGSSVAGSSQVQVSASAVSAAATGTPSISQSNTPSISNPNPPLSSGASAAATSVFSAAATPSISTSHIRANKTKTGLAAITCRQDCQRTFRTCKKTTRQLRTCKRAKKTCVSGCGVVNPNRR